MNCNDTSALTESPDIIFARKPVIYFHEIENATTVNVYISPIENITTIPYAKTASNSPEPSLFDNDFIDWNIVVENNIIKGYDVPSLPIE